MASIENLGGPYMQKQGNRTISIVRFGIFQVKEITMPAAAEDLTTHIFSHDTSQHYRVQKGRTSLISSMLGTLRGHSIRKREALISTITERIQAHLQCLNCGILHWDTTLIWYLSQGLFGCPGCPRICNVYGEEKWTEGKFLLIQIGLLCRSINLGLSRGTTKIIESVNRGLCWRRSLLRCWFLDKIHRSGGRLAWKEYLLEVGL